MKKKLDGRLVGALVLGVPLSLPIVFMLAVNLFLLGDWSEQRALNSVAWSNSWNISNLPVTYTVVGQCVTAVGSSVPDCVEVHTENALYWQAGNKYTHTAYVCENAAGTRFEAYFFLVGIEPR